MVFRLSAKRRRQNERPFDFDRRRNIPRDPPCGIGEHLPHVGIGVEEQPLVDRRWKIDDAPLPIFRRDDGRLLMLGLFSGQIHAIIRHHFAACQWCNLGGAGNEGNRPFVGRMSRAQPRRILLRADQRIVHDRMIGFERQVQVFNPLRDRVCRQVFRPEQISEREVRTFLKIRVV